MIWVTFNNIEKSRLGSLSLETRWGKLGDVLPFWRRNMSWPKKNVLYSRPLEIFIDFINMCFFSDSSCQLQTNSMNLHNCWCIPFDSTQMPRWTIPSFVLCVSGVVDSLPPGWWNMYPILYIPLFLQNLLLKWFFMQLSECFLDSKLPVSIVLR